MLLAEALKGVMVCLLFWKSDAVSLEFFQLFA